MKIYLPLEEIVLILYVYSIKYVFQSLLYSLLHKIFSVGPRFD